MVSLVSVTPTLIEPGETVTVTWSVVDPSGLADWNAYPWTDVDALGGSNSNETDTTRISGDRYDGVYQAQLVVTYPPGTNDLTIRARDTLGNYSTTTFEDQLEIVSG